MTVRVSKYSFFSIVFLFSILLFFLKIDFIYEMKNESSPRVLGESNENGFSDSSGKNFLKSYGKDNFFLPDTNKNIEFVPVKKKDVQDIKIWSKASVAIDVDSGTILHYDNGRKKTQVASLTKIMTAILIVENVPNLEKETVISKEALWVPGTVVGCPMSGFCNSNRLYAGEKISIRNILHAMLLNSANDAAKSLAIHISGAEEKFVDMMNAKVKELGLKDTHFCTSSGLEIDEQEQNCYSSAYDMARIASYSLQYDLIWDIMRIDEEKIYSSDGKYMHQLKNTDILLGEMENCLGGKTGFTPLAGKSLLTATVDETKKHRVVAVILDDPDRWGDMRRLTQWIFDSYDWRRY
ncbi:MAG: hypothetical protein COZ85_02745 [Candidatus Moranbacteria bacterium CG_4_8_14_3_um_filter_34_16]|nr:MAG: hypothetical protein COZ85_02745 [Candidatus Moranbacteria bacterium CG_4_8_14_3_um_filter_34_16]PJA89502.1 MAG: hypothetical protein CO138_00125 [Candidatus Moranbacteria bacterium CG_4_9_14_3_um_filter_33_15]